VSIFNNLFGGKNESSNAGNEPVKKAVHKTISAHQAKVMMSQGKPFILLDVRSPEEFNEGHIAGAVLMPDYEVKKRAEKELADKNTLILVYCHSGMRAAGAAAALAKMGYTNVNTFGGIMGWPYGIVK